MTDLRTSAIQALEALVRASSYYDTYAEISALEAALAEPTTEDSSEVEPVQEPPCATRECMPSECPNCVSLQDQNTELDRKLADLEQTSLELCNVCGWKTLIPGDCCLNCVRKPMNEFDALRLITESIGRLQSAGPVEGLIGIIRAVERAHGIK